MSQLTMLNMLIAIMGDSFDRVFENREIHAVSQKLQILSDLSAALPQTSNEEELNTIFVVAKPTEDQEDEEGDEWEGTLKRLTRVVERQARATQEMLSSKAAKIEQSIEDSAARESSQNRLFRAQIEQQLQYQN